VPSTSFFPVGQPAVFEFLFPVCSLCLGSVICSAVSLTPGFKRSAGRRIFTGPSFKRMAAGCNGNERPFLFEIAPSENVTELTAFISRKSKKNRPFTRNKVPQFRKKSEPPVFGQNKVRHFH
jgi:hypothetical protein